MTTKPMLAGKAPADLSKLVYPVLTSPKLDGIRCLVADGRVLARSLKPIPNAHVRDLLCDANFEGFDGELISGATFGETTSAIMSRSGQPAFAYHVFDLRLDTNRPFRDRLSIATRTVDLAGLDWLRAVPHRWARTPADVEDHEADALAAGFEGLMIRDPDGPYKAGRSTEREGWLLKLKRFADGEAEVIGFEEQLHNTNEATTNELGRTKRSSAQAGLVGAGVLGKLIVRDLASGVEFGLGTGFNAEQRADLWHSRATLAGRIVKYKSQPYGVKDAPRLPVFIGFRAVEDMSNG